ncbi:hypothetical protein ABIE45_004695 [Methylobacterium sp. OAE515]|uniref:hypothetical protein n=1 Tax=Methylobacterium sp. OAE515 TaxID=2817895 RepID=UPI00178C0934
MDAPDQPPPRRPRIVIDFARNRAEELAELKDRIQTLVTECVRDGRPPDPDRLRKLGLSGQRAFFRALIHALRREAKAATPAPTRPAARRGQNRRSTAEADRPGVIAAADWPERRRRRAALADRVTVEVIALGILLTGLCLAGLHFFPQP